jgi:hypothetical protein
VTARRRDAATAGQATGSPEACLRTPFHATTAAATYSLAAPLPAHTQPGSRVTTLDRPAKPPRPLRPAARAHARRPTNP